MKDLDIRMVLLLAFPLIFAVLFLLFLQTFEPVFPPELSTAITLLFFPFFLLTFLFLNIFLSIFHFQVFLAGILLFALLCAVVQYYYVRIMRQRQGRQGIPLVVATYLLTGLLMSMVILFPSVGQGDTDMPQLTLSKVDKNETSGSLIHFTQQDLEESPALQSLIESGHTSMS